VAALSVGTERVSIDVSEVEGQSCSASRMNSAPRKPAAKDVEPELNGRSAATEKGETTEDGSEDAPSVLSRCANAADVPDVSFGIDAPAADALTASLLVDLGATATNHVAVESFHELPEQVQADACAQEADENTANGEIHHGTTYVVPRGIQSISDAAKMVS